MKNDAQLLREFAEENLQPAFAELVRRHIDLVFSVALHKVGRDAHAAQDVSQTVFLALARQARSLTSRESLSGWLYLTTQNHAAQWVRAERRRQTWEARAETMNQILNTPDVDWRQLRPVLDDTMRQLGERDREVILLRYFEGQAFSVIGRTFQISEDAARMRADRALEKLRSLLARRGFSSTAAALAGILGQQVAAAPSALAASIVDALAAQPIVSTKPLMTTARLLTGAAVAAAVTALIVARSPEQGSVPATAIQSPTVTPSVAQSPATVALARMPARTTNVPVTAVTARPAAEVLEPAEPATVRGAELARQLAGYVPLLEKLALPADQRSRLTELLAINLQRRADIREIGRTQGTRPLDVDIEALETEADAELSSRVHATFGPLVQEALDHFNETGPVREFVHHLAESLAQTASPLAPADSDRLVEIIAQHSRQPDGRIPRDPYKLDVEAAINDGRSSLAPPQILALRQLRSQLR